jgi:hypothetical protein
MQTNNAAELCQRWGFRCEVSLRNGRFALEIGTDAGWFAVPVVPVFDPEGYLSEWGNVDGEIVSAILQRHQPPPSGQPAPGARPGSSRRFWLR